MKKKIFFIFFISLIVLIGCKSKEKSSILLDNDNNRNYSETEIEIPNELSFIDDMAVVNNKKIILTGIEEKQNNETVSIWTCDLEKKSWNREINLSGIEEFNLTTDDEISTQVSPNGNIVCIIKKNIEDNNILEFYLFQEDGIIKKLDKLEEIVSTADINTLTFFNDKYFFAYDLKGNCYIIDLENLDIKSKFQINNNYIQSFSENGDIITILTLDNNLSAYDINTGSKIDNYSTLFKTISTDLNNELAHNGATRIVATDNGYDLLNNSGIYQYTDKKTKMLLSGKYTSFGTSTSTLIDVFKEGKDFYSWTVDSDGDSIFKYEYNQRSNDKYNEDKSLSIYSLYENEYISDTINAFSRKNTNVNIDYKIGLSNEASITETEAIKDLNTKIISNDSPDIIVLDGLNSETYIEKDLLEDLSSIISENKNLLPGSYENFLNNSKIYGIASKIKIPIFIQKDKKIDNYNDISDLVSKIDKTSVDTDINKLDPASRYNTASILYTIYFNDPKNINEKSLLNFYSLLERVHDIEIEGVSNPEGEGRQINDIDVSKFSFGAADIILDEEAIYAFDYVTSISYLRDILYFRQLNINSEVIKFDDNSKKYISESVFSVSKNSKNKKVALDFVSQALSEPYQSKDTYNGIPVNVESISNLMNNVESEQLKGSHSQEGDILSMDGFTDEESNEITSFLKGSRSISPEDIIIHKLIIDGAQSMFAEGTSKEENAKTVYSKISLYNAEK